MSLDNGTTSETNRDIIKSVSLKYLRDHLLKNSSAIFSRFEKLKDCLCDHFGGEECRCGDESCNGVQNVGLVEDDVDGAHYHVGDINEDFHSSFHITEADEADEAADEFDASVVPSEMIHSTHAQFSSMLKQPQSVPAQSGHYTMKKPYVLIICNVKFHNRLRPRNGAAQDVRHIKEFCEHHLQLPEESVVLRENLTMDEMQTELLCTATNSSLGTAYDSLICFIMSHGSKDGVLGRDNKPLPVDSILDIFKGSNCPSLIGKPKLFFIQACRGDRNDQGCTVPRGDIVTDNNEINEEPDKPVKLPTDADILVAYSTTKHHISLRSFATRQYVKSIGSWFIYNLVHVFWQFSHKEDVLSMMQMVNNAMANMHTGADPEEGLKQISCQLSMLRYKLYFKNYRN